VNEVIGKSGATKRLPDGLRIAFGFRFFQR